MGVDASSQIEDSILWGLNLGLESDEWHLLWAERSRGGRRSLAIRSVLSWFRFAISDFIEKLLDSRECHRVIGSFIHDRYRR